jgi:hypothetical protein
MLVMLDMQWVTFLDAEDAAGASCDGIASFLCHRIYALISKFSGTEGDAYPLAERPISPMRFGSVMIIYVLIL